MELSPEEVKLRDVLKKKIVSEDGNRNGNNNTDRDGGRMRTRMKNERERGGLVRIYNSVKGNSKPKIGSEEVVPLRHIPMGWNGDRGGDTRLSRREAVQQDRPIRDMNRREGRGSILQQDKPAAASGLQVPRTPKHAEESPYNFEIIPQYSCADCGSKNNTNRPKCRICGAPKPIESGSQAGQNSNDLSPSSQSPSGGSDPTYQWRHVRKVTAATDATDRAMKMRREAREEEERQQKELLNKILQESRPDYVGLNRDRLQPSKSRNMSDGTKNLTDKVASRNPVENRSTTVVQPSQLSTETQNASKPWAAWTRESQDSYETRPIKPEKTLDQTKDLIKRVPSKTFPVENKSFEVVQPSQSNSETLSTSSSWAVWTPEPQDLESTQPVEPEDQIVSGTAENGELKEEHENDRISPPIKQESYTARHVSDHSRPKADQTLKEEPEHHQVSQPKIRKFLKSFGNSADPSFNTEPLYDEDETKHTRSYLRIRGREDRAKRDRIEEEDYSPESTESRAERKQRRKQEKMARKAARPPMPIILPEFISIGNLATALHVRVEEFMQKMVSLGFEETNGDYVLDAETAGLVATEFNYEPIIERGQADDLVPQPLAEDKSVLPPRPPVVTIMGHVDHGKTTLLDYLRKSSVAASEHGGITQHIGAFKVSMPSGRVITFLDTPGHAAFLSMRQRGANVTDIVILVVAADDSVKPQTIEAIRHAQAAKVPIIVAINKVDKGDSNVERVKQDLARHGVDVEDFGGETQVVCVSGKTGLGMGELEDAAIALADVLDLRAETDGQAEGWVLEATTKQQGRVATVLVRRGTIYQGNVIVAGTTWAKVRTMRNEAGVSITAAGPGTPVEIDGWREQPNAGDEVLQANDEQHAKLVVDIRLERVENTQLAADMIAINEARRIEQEKREQERRDREEEKQLAEAEGRQAVFKPPIVETPSGIKDVSFIVKADVSGSVEAVVNSISALGNEEVRANILRAAVGNPSEFDIEHAAAAKGHIISFNVPVEQSIGRMAEAAGVEILEQNIIYKLIDEVKARLTEQLAPSVTVRVLGEAEIAQIFQINTKGRLMTNVAGCRVRNGVISRSAKTRVLRDRETIYNGMCF